MVCLIVSMSQSCFELFPDLQKVQYTIKTPVNLPAIVGNAMVYVIMSGDYILLFHYLNIEESTGYPEYFDIWAIF